MIDYSLILSIYYANNNWSLNGSSYEGFIWLENSPKPNKEHLDSLYGKALSISKKKNCKDQAKQLIANSDWSVLPDVNITNKSDFENYRSQLRNLILNPVEDPIFPVEPNPIWSK